MNNKVRSHVSQNSNSLNAMIKKTSMNKKQRTTNGKKLLMTIAASTVLLSAIFTVGLGDQMAAFAAKPQENGAGKDVIKLSNGYPSGEHENLNVHGKKLNWDGDCTPGGKSINVPLYTTGLDDQTIQILSNKKSSQADLTAIDPCSEQFDNDPAKVQLPYVDELGYYVFARSAGTPNNSDGEPSKIMITPNGVLEACNQDTINDPNNDFGDLTSCYDENGDLVDTIVLGLVTSNGVYKKTDEEFVRYEDSTKGKGIKKAVDITGLFEWTGAVCDDTLDTNGDKEITWADFAVDEATFDLLYGNDSGTVTTDELIAFLQANYAAECEFFENEWVFNVADLVVQSNKIDNDGTKLWKVRFYPVSTTTFIPYE